MNTPPEDPSDQAQLMSYAPAEPEGPRHCDLLMVDLLHPDWANFFTRYRVDLIGFAVIAFVCASIIVLTKLLAMIGAGQES